MGNGLNSKSVFVAMNNNNEENTTNVEEQEFNEENSELYNRLINAMASIPKMASIEACLAMINYATAFATFDKSKRSYKDAAKMLNGCLSESFKLQTECFNAILRSAYADEQKESIDRANAILEYLVGECNVKEDSATYDIAKSIIEQSIKAEDIDDYSAIVNNICDELDKNKAVVTKTISNIVFYLRNYEEFEEQIEEYGELDKDNIFIIFKNYLEV